MKPAPIFILALAAMALSSCGSSPPAATPQPSTQVTALPPQRGSLPRLIEGYGTSAPAANGQTTLSVPQPGQVTGLGVTPGAMVRAGQPIVTFTVAPSARSSFNQATDALKAAQSQRQTTAQLLSQQLATRDQLAQADKAVADARSALAALSAEGAGAGVITLRAPFAGVVAALPVVIGDRTQPGQALATVARAGGLVVTVGIDPAARGVLRPGAAARIDLLGGGAGVAGHVVRIDDMLNPRTHQIDVDIGYPNGAILSGEAVRVAIETGQAAGWIVPHRAVVTSADGSARVFQIVGGKAKAVPVSLLATTPQKDAVSGAIAPAAPLIVDGAYQVADGDAVHAGSAR